MVAIRSWCGVTVHDDLAVLLDPKKLFWAKKAAASRVEVEVARLEQRVKFCPSCAGAFVPETEPYEGPCAGCRRAEAAEAEIARLRARLDAAHRYRESQEGLPPGTLRRDLADQDGAATCEKCRHPSHEPGACEVNVGTGYHGPVLCRCGVLDPAPPTATIDLAGAATCCCPAGSYNPGNVHEDYCPLGGAA